MLVVLRRSEHRAENLIAMPDEQLREEGSVLPADPGNERTPRHRSRTLPVPVAVIGAGNMGRHHARNYQEFAQADLRAIVDTDLERAEALASRHGCRAFPSIEELLAEEPGVAAVSVVTPTRTH